VKVPSAFIVTDPPWLVLVVPGTALSVPPPPLVSPVRTVPEVDVEGWGGVVPTPKVVSPTAAEKLCGTAVGVGFTVKETSGGQRSCWRPQSR